MRQAHRSPGAERSAEGAFDTHLVIIDRSGIPFIVAAWIPAGVLALLGLTWGAVPLAVLGAFFVFFFRDPQRDAPEEPNVVLAPADGRVLVAGRPQSADVPNGAWRQVSIFLSPIDVHINRAPIAGEVTHVEHRPGRFLAAYRPQAGEENERTEVWFEAHGHRVICRQIVGVLARRIVCRARSGDRVRAGDRFGIMKFGSRIDLFLPEAAVLDVQLGQRVRGGETILARLPVTSIPGEE